MKTFAILILIGLTQAQADDRIVVPGLVRTSFQTSYIPDGFDSNDHVQVTGEGYFPNTCYRPASIDLRIDHKRKTIQLVPLAYYYGGYCAQMIVPFDRTIDIGILKTGKYHIYQADEALPFGDVKIRAATNSGPDDFQYAPIEQAYVESKDGQTQLHIQGKFTKSCMKLIDVNVEVQSNVLVVRPISEEDESPCEDGEFAFERSVAFKAPKGRYLLHVRTLNANSINKLVDVQ